MKVGRGGLSRVAEIGRINAYLSPRLGTGGGETGEGPLVYLTCNVHRLLTDNTVTSRFMKRCSQINGVVSLRRAIIASRSNFQRSTTC